MSLCIVGAKNGSKGQEPRETQRSGSRCYCLFGGVGVTGDLGSLELTPISKGDLDLIENEPLDSIPKLGTLAPFKTNDYSPSSKLNLNGFPFL